MSVHKGTRSSLLSVGKASSAPLQFYVKVNSAGLCHNLVQRDLEHLSLLQIHAGDTVLLGPCEQDVATTLDLLVVPVCTKGWKRNPRAFYLSEIPRRPVLWGMQR